MRFNTNVTESCVEGDIPNPNPALRKSSQVPFKDFPKLQAAREKITALGRALGLSLEGLFCEINYYFPGNRSGIGRHGDTERNMVIGGCVSDGSSQRVIQWCEYHRSDPVPGRLWELTLSGGDCYIMSGDAVGTNWNRSSKYTLRHCAGSRAFVDRITAAAVKKAEQKAAKRQNKASKPQHKRKPPAAASQVTVKKTRRV